MVVCPRSGTGGGAAGRWWSALEVEPGRVVPGDGGLPSEWNRGWVVPDGGGLPSEWNQVWVVPGGGGLPSKWNRAVVVCPQSGNDELTPDFRFRGRPPSPEEGILHANCREPGQTAAMSALPSRCESARVVSTSAFAIGEATSSGTLTVVPTMAIAAVIAEPSKMGAAIVRTPLMAGEFTETPCVRIESSSCRSSGDLRSSFASVGTCWFGRNAQNTRPCAELVRSRREPVRTLIRIRWSVLSAERTTVAGLAVPDTEHDRLADLLDERFHVRLGSGDDGQAGTGGRGECEHLRAEGVERGALVVAQQVRRSQRLGVAMRRRLARAEPRGDLVEAQMGLADGERIEDQCCALHRLDGGRGGRIDLGVVLVSRHLVVLSQPVRAVTICGPERY